MDLTDISFSQNPYAFYSKLRKDGNVHYIEKNNIWLVIGYNDIKKCLIDFDHFTSEGENAFDPILLNCDPPAHTKHRKILVAENGLFSPNRIDSLEEQNREICRDLLEQLKGKHSIEFLSELAMPFSTLVILNLLGINTQSTTSLKEWSSGAVLNTSLYNTQFANEQWNKLKPLVRKWIEEAKINGSRFGIAELFLKKESDFLNDENNLLDLVKILLLGGNETTPNLVSSALLILLKKPDLLDKIRENPMLLSDFIYEVLRFEAPTQLLQRTTKKEIQIGGYTIPTKATVAFGIGAANRDPEVFQHPDEFDIDRPKEKILSFGFGPHYCLGAHLAKQEAQIVLEALLNNFPEMALTDNFTPKYRYSSHVRGLQSLPVYTTHTRNKITHSRSLANDLLTSSLNKYYHFPSLENYPQINPNGWHYTFPSPFVHANVMHALQNLNDKKYNELLQKGMQFLLQQKEANDTWRFWKVNECRNPVPPDIDDLSICSVVLERAGLQLFNKELLYENINADGSIKTWIIPGFSKLFKFPRLVCQALVNHNKISQTINDHMLHADDYELGVMANALLYLGENEKTTPVIDRCIQLWQTKTDQRNFYDNDLVVAFHLARAYHSGIKSFHVIMDDIIKQVNAYPFHPSLCESILAHLIAIYFNHELLMRETKAAIIEHLDLDQKVFAPYKYFTSKDRNYYGGSDCLTAAWFLEATQNW
ncbi:MAG: cytochrome P450 [Bacteroidota bacterium]|jgi:cytochrome P450